VPIAIGGDLVVERLGFGAMRLVGAGAFGPPPDLAAAQATVKLLPELGVSYVDTSNAYGPLISEMLVRSLHPYAGIVVATKGGLLRPAPFQWHPDGRPEMLRAAVLGSLKTLGVERLDVWQLHVVDPKVPAGEQYGAIAAMQREGLIRHVGLSNVSVEQIDEARRHLTVATVTHLYHVIDRRNEPVLEHCERLGIPFVAYAPLAVAALAEPDSILARTAGKLGITPGQAALAWLLRRSPAIIAIWVKSRTGLVA